MRSFFQTVARRLFQRSPNRTQPARRSPRLQLEQLEKREVLTVTDMTQLGLLFAPHAGPTMLYLNFDGGTVSYQDSGAKTRNISAYQSPTGTRAADIAAIQSAVAQVFASFDVEVVPVSGAGWYDSSNNGNTTVFIGSDSSNTSFNFSTYKFTKYSNSFTPASFSDAPGQTKGYNHQPNSDAFDLAFIDPVGQDASGNFRTQNTTQIAQLIAHEAGHTFGLEHVLTGDGTGNPSPLNPPEVMSYDAPNVSFLDKTFNVTDYNNNPATKSIYHAGNAFLTQWNDNGTNVVIATQNSYTYLTAVLGKSMSQVAVASNADGSQTAFAIGGDHAVWYRKQLADNFSWSTWRSMGGFVEQIAVGHNQDGRLEVFGIGGNNAVYHAWQVTPNGGYSGWANDLSNSYATQIAVSSNADGRMEVFVVGGDHALYHAWQMAPNAGFNGYWASELGGYVKQFTVGHNADGRMEIFAISGDNAVYHKWQVVPSGYWYGTWATDLRNGYLTQIAVSNNADGRMELFGIGGNGAVYHTWQAVRDGGWNTSWAADLSQSYVTQIAVGTNADGRMEVFGIGGDGQAYHAWQLAPNSGWSAWDTLAVGYVRQIAIGTNVRGGGMDVFAVGGDYSLYQAWQFAPNNSKNGWSGWMYLGGGVV